MSNELLEKRKQRLADCLELKEPDQVPIFTQNQFFPAVYIGITHEDAFYDQDKWLEAYNKYLEDYQPDFYMPPFSAIGAGGKSHEMLNTKQIKWPGPGGLAPNAGFQFVEDEYMKAEEYDDLIDDPSDFILRKYLPRVFENLKGLDMLPPIKTFAQGHYTVPVMGVFSAPPVAQSLQTLMEVAQETGKWSHKYGEFRNSFREKGHLEFFNAVTLHPFDLLSDMFRGMKGSLMDILRRPEKVKAAQEKFLPSLIGGAIQMAQMGNNNVVFIPLHRGSDDFMSVKQFEEIYWPYLKRLLEGLISAGITPYPFFEGLYDQRLEYLQDLPKKKILGGFDRSDIFKVKEMLGETMCIVGGMPIDKLMIGNKEEIREHTRQLVDIVGKDGGFVMSTNSVLDDADPERIRIWIEATREFGNYR